jgi:hypothetical protein|tara:strand:+ start:870 stop:1142 length:273 start_codon:yes stop_codon:yes gene_type:complete
MFQRSRRRQSWSISLVQENAGLSELAVQDIKLRQKQSMTNLSSVMERTTPLLPLEIQQIPSTAAPIQDNSPDRLIDQKAASGIQQNFSQC